MQKILFIGATGMLGKPVAEQLAREGFELTILSRDVAKAKNALPGLKLISGDVFDKASLVTAMHDAEVVYINLSVQPNSREQDPQPEREGIANIVEAARQTGIKRIIYLSSLAHLYQGMNGFNWWVFQLKSAAVTQIKSSGIPYTIFYPSTFMDTYTRLLQGNKIPVMGKSLVPMWFIAASDYARQVAASLRISGAANKTYTVQGPQPLTWDEANKVFIAAYRPKKLKVLRAPSGMMKLLGTFSPTFNYGYHICEALNKYPEKFESDITWKELGKPLTTLDEFARSL